MVLSPCKLGHTYGVKVLRIDLPDGRRVLKFDGAFGPEGGGIALRCTANTF